MSKDQVNLIKLRVSSFTSEFLNCSWTWLNDPEIKLLTATPDFTREQQLMWYETLASKSDYLIWGLEINERPAGVFGIKNIDGGHGEYWGYIGSKEYWGIGAGTWMMRQVLGLAADSGISRLYLKVLKTNLAAIKLYKKMQFNKYRSDERFDWMGRSTDHTGF